MTDGKLELTRRKILAGVGGVGAAGAAAGLGTSALFSDEESFTNNEIQAGELDLIVDYETSVDQDGVDTGSTTGGSSPLGGPARINGNPASGEYVIKDLKPGDSGQLIFCPKIVDNPGWLWVGSVDGLTGFENGQTEPEEDVDDTGGDPGEGQGELAEAIEVDVSYINPPTPGAERELNNPDRYTLADLFKELESGFLLDGEPYSDDPSGTQAYPSSPNENTQEGPCLLIEWEVPASVGNEIQSDSLEFDITFAAVQERNNPAPDNPFADTTVAPGDDLASVVGGASSDKTISVFGGDFGDGSDFTTRFDVTEDGVTLARASAERPVLDVDAGSAIGIDADDVTIDGFRVRNPANGVSASPSSFAGAIGIDVDSQNENVCVQNCELVDIGTGNDDANPIGVYAQGATSGITVRHNRIENLEGTDEDEGAVQAVLINSQKAQSGISSGIDDASVTGNVITGLLDTRSTNAVRFNGDVSGEISNNEISDMDTEGTTSSGDPGGFTQVISLAQGGNSTTGPSDVDIRGNEISNIETTTADNFFPPFHVILGGSTDGTTVSIDSNDFSGDSNDDEVYVGDGSGGLNLNEVLSDNSFTPSGTIDTSGSIDVIRRS